MVNEVKVNLEGLDPDKEYNFIIDEKDRKPKKNNCHNRLFYYMAIGCEDLRAENSMDAMEHIVKFTKAELFLLGIMHEQINPMDLIMTVKKSDYTVGEKQRLVSAIKLWLDKGLLRRIRREKYMINPNFITPSKDNHEVINAAWDKLNNGEE